MKAPYNYHLIIPTWSEQELQFVNRKIDDWYERFVTFGGVPRFVLWGRKGNDPLEKLQEALGAEGANVINYFFHNGFGNMDPEKSYMLMHINSSWLPEQDDWNYLGRAVHSFASDAIFQTLSKKYYRSLLSESINAVAPGVYRGGSAGSLFEKVDCHSQFMDRPSH